jgi:UDP-glucose-4-epimerase GalE
MTLVLVTGASGYVGSAVCAALAGAGWDVLGVDRAPLPPRHPLPPERLRICDVTDGAALARAIGSDRPAAAIHMAGSIDVAESMRDPMSTYRNNLGTTVSVCELARDLEMRAIVFSSSAAVYGTPAAVPIREDAPKEPINPYGASKAFSERLVADAAMQGVRGCSLRYFNAAGASRDGRIGERHDPETHLIPRVLRAALGRGPPLSVHGRDFPTPDGTAVRDYVHIEDLARAHVLALEKVLAGDAPAAVNLGGGKGSSVLEVIAACEAALGRPVPRTDAPRRPGDPPVLVAAIDRAWETLGWRPERSELPTIVEDALRFETTS